MTPFRVWQRSRTASRTGVELVIENHQRRIGLGASNAEAVGGNFWSLIGGYALPWGRAATTEIYPNSHRITSTAITNSAPAIIVTPVGPSTSKRNSTNSAAHCRHARRSFSSTTRQSSDAARIMTPVSCPAPSLARRCCDLCEAVHRRAPAIFPSDLITQNTASQPRSSSARCRAVG
jgi:hypothetical protein